LKGRRGVHSRIDKVWIKFTTVDYEINNRLLIRNYNNSSSLEIDMADTCEESSSECSDSISSNNFSNYMGSSSLDLMETSSETVIFAGKTYLKINLLVKTPLHEFLAVTRSG